jgi:hypothetical protein
MRSSQGGEASEDLYVDGVEALGTLFYLEADGRTVGNVTGGDGFDVNEDVLGAIIWCDETVTLVVVEKFDCSLHGVKLVMSGESRLS